MSETEKSNKNAGGKPEKVSKKLQIALRREKVSQFVLMGLSYRKIAETLEKMNIKCTKSTVENDVEAIFGEADKTILKNIGTLRKVNFDRLEDLIKANWVEAKKGNLKAGEFIRKCIDDQINVYNAAIPKTVDHNHQGSVENVHVGISLEEWKKTQAERRAQAEKTAELFNDETGNE